MRTKQFIIIALLLISKIGSAQNIGDTCVPANIKDYNTLIKYFMAEKQDVNQLFKFDILQLAYYRLNMSYEWKSTINSTMEAGVSLGPSKLPEDETSNYDTKFDLFFMEWTAPVLKISYDYKLFHNITKRNKIGKNTNRFSGNYLSVGVSSYIFIHKKKHYILNPDGSTSAISEAPTEVSHFEKQNFVLRTDQYKRNESIVFINMGYGLQRSIGNFGFVSADLKLGFGSNKEFNRLYIMPTFNIKAGFALSALSKQNR